MRQLAKSRQEPNRGVDLVCQSVRANGVVGSLLLVAVAVSGLEWPVRLLIEKGTNVEKKYETTDASNSPSWAKFVPTNKNFSFGEKLVRSLMNGETALMAAAREGHTGVVRALIEKGANVDAVGSLDGHSALMTACRHGQLSVVKLLLDKGADVDKEEPTGFNVLIITADEYHCLYSLHAIGVQGHAEQAGIYDAIIRLLVEMTMKKERSDVIAAGPI